MDRDHCIVDRELFEAIATEFGEYFEPSLRLEYKKCNCELKAKIRLNRAQIEFKDVDLWWICPVHGYKRLQ